MRLHYRSMTRPRHVARRMQTIFPALSLTSAQHWTARIMGYRDWHELRQSVNTNAGEETPDIVVHITEDGIGNQDELSALFRRQFDQQEVLSELAGEDLVDMPGLFFAVDPNQGGFPFRKLGSIAKGNPFYRGLAHDLFDYESEGSPGCGSGRCESIGIDDDAPYICMGLPKGGDRSGVSPAPDAQHARS